VTIRFETDAGNAAIHNSQDPGFYLDWHISESIIARGDGICPALPVYTSPHGVIHDQLGDLNCNSAPGGCDHAGNGNANGYNDRTNCYTTIHAPVGSQVRWTFTQLNLELTGCNANQPNGGCPAGGCDFVKIYDGQSNHARLLGQFSGFQTGVNLPSVISTGEWMRIEFHTDVGNCGITSNQDPGFMGSWDFVSNGQNICQPDSPVLTAHRGVLHDDDVSTGTSYENGVAQQHNQGYGDNLNCGVRIRAPPGATVNLHIVQMNLEGDGNGICDPHSPHYIGHSCNGNGGDFLKIYDGRDAHARLMASLNGQPTDSVRIHDTFTSTGRDMYVHFETDSGNYGLTGTTASPGFYAEWTIIHKGRQCTQFQGTPGHGLIGHNNEVISQSTVAECQHFCCARPWCKSFDYIASLNGGTCELADISYTEDQGILGNNPANTYYERPLASLSPALVPLGATGCQARLGSISSVVTHECCGVGGCRTGLPPVCSEQCAASWLPFSKQCSVWLSLPSVNEHLEVVSHNCERSQYGRYHRGQARGRCADNDIAAYERQVQAACCRPEHGRGTLCPGIANGQRGWDLMPPTDPTTHQPVCTSHCRRFFEEVYAECHPRFNDDLASQGAHLRQFLCICQGLDQRTCASLAPSGGNHRLLTVMDDESQAEAGEEEQQEDELDQEFLAAMQPAAEVVIDPKLTWEEMLV
jgi:hypothetical protein